MSSRLQTIYDDIKASNHEAYANNDIHIDTDWGKDIWGVTLQVDLAEQVKDQVVTYQEALEKIEPGNFYSLPREFQHISFNQVIFWNGDYAKGTQKIWEDVKDTFIEEFTKRDRAYNSFEIRFSQLIPTKAGIIWCAKDADDSMEKLRDQLLEDLPFPEETTKRNHIVHTTVVRHKNSLKDPQKVIDFTEKHTESVTMKVSQILLKEELVFPSIKMKELARIELK